MNTKRLLQLSITTILILATLLPQTTGAQASNGLIAVNINTAEIQAMWFQAGATARLTIDDPGTAQTPDYTDSAVIPSTGNPWVTFSLDPFVLKDGFVIKVTDQVSTKQLIYRKVSINKINTESNIVSSTSVPSSMVDVSVKLSSGDTVGGGSTSDASGNWTFDFGSPNPEDAIQNGKTVRVNLFDSDYDYVRYEQTILPRIEARLSEYFSGHGGIDTSGWVNGSLVTLKVDDPTTVESPDFTFTKTATWDRVGFYPSPYPPNGFPRAGELVTVEGNNVSASHTVQKLKVTKTDVIHDFIGGIADPNQEILLDLPLSGGKRMNVETLCIISKNGGESLNPTSNQG